MDVDNNNSNSNKDELNELLKKHSGFIEAAGNIKAGDILEPLIDMFYQSGETIHRTWSSFSLLHFFTSTFRNIRFHPIHDYFVVKDYHTRQVDMRPNVIQSLLEGVSRCDDLQLPPFAVECLASNFDAWSQGIHILENIDEKLVNANAEVREVTEDALAKLYATLKEDDMFYGLWRRRAKYAETISALSFEQLGLWDKAQQLYETAQIKARSGAFTIW